MPMDAVILHGLTRKLTQSLTGARIDKVQQPERDLLLLSVRTQSGNARLLVHGGVGSARVHFTRGTLEPPAEPPMFCMLLRKHLGGARITAVSQPDFERMLVLDLDGRIRGGVDAGADLVDDLGLDAVTTKHGCGAFGGPDVESKLHQSRSEQRQLTLVGIVHGDEHVAAGRQTAIVGGQLALGERMREVTVEAHDFAGGTHFRSENRVYFREHIEWDNRFLDTIIWNLLLFQFRNR